MAIGQRRRTALSAHVMIAALVLGLVVVACAPGFDMVRTDPGLYPAFQLSAIDYVTRATRTTRRTSRSALPRVGRSP